MVMRRVPVVWEDGRLGLPSRLMGWLRLHVWTLSITRRVRLPWVSVAKSGSFDRKQGRLLVAGLLSRCQDGFITFVDSGGCNERWVFAMLSSMRGLLVGSDREHRIQYAFDQTHGYVNVVTTSASLVLSMTIGDAQLKDLIC
jgi:hypothetical protein